MSDPLPAKSAPIVIGLDEAFSFVNTWGASGEPLDLRLDLSERCTLQFSLDEKLVRAGWRFQRMPIEIRRDYGVNFSSYIWRENTVDGKTTPFTRFDIIYECNRLGEYEYSLFMTDGHGQGIDLDPKIENGGGRTGGHETAG